MYRFYTLLLALLISAGAFAQSPVLVKDINANIADAASGSNPNNGFILNGKLYFAATDYQGREPWKTDGTSSGTVIIKDILSNVPNYSSNPHSMVGFGSTTYFFTGDSSSSQLWKIGTDDSARFVMGGFIYPHDVVSAGNYIFLSGKMQGSSVGQELLRFDPSAVSIQAFDINPGAASSDPRFLTVKRDSVFFSADDGTTGRELWIYDPISFNKVDEVSDINTGVDPSDPYDIVIYHDSIFFSGNSGPDGVEIFYSDGLVGGAGTGVLAFINNNNGGADSSNPANKTIFNNKIIFSANDSSHGTELWAYDGTTGVTDILADINTSSPGAASNPGKYGFHQAGLFLYFAANDGVHGNELWRTDGNFGGTTALVQDINTSGNSDPQSMYNVGDTLIFAANNGSGPQIWRAKFNTAALIQAIQPALSSNWPQLFASYNNKIYFSADNGSSGIELYSTNGLSAGTGLVKDIFNNGSATNSNIPWLENFSSAIFFAATKNSLTEPDGLYKTDGTFAGTVEVVAPGGATGFYVASPAGKAAGSLLFFRGHNNAAGEELWKSDGTAGGTALVKDINAGTNSSSVNNITSFGSKVLFLADDGTNGQEMWVSDGSSGGTFLLKNINPAANAGSFIQNITVVGTKAFFTADDGTNGRELWVTDGTVIGTSMVKNINPGAPASNPGGLTAVGTSLYFYANDGTNGNEPWKSDGTLGGTNIIKDINPGSNSSMGSGGFCNFGGFSYFNANDATGAKLWRTDGTSVGTVLFNSVENPYIITNIGSKMVFFSYPSVHPYGYEVYNSDGTTVTKIKDFAPNSLDILPDSFSVYVGKAFCPLEDNSHGQELFGTDGTASGSVLFDIAPGAASSYPRYMKGLLTSILFSAYDNTSKGNELWKLDVSGTLPVSGLEFNVSKKDNSALLNWKTYTEFNNKGFEIQRSNDGRNFTDSLGFVNAKAFADNGASYTFTDAAPLSGRNYYRLKQKDFDGHFTYSPVRWIDFGKDIYVKVYPNPATDIVNINSSYAFKNAILSIRSSSGQLIRQQTINGSGTISIPVKNLSAGIYFIEINEGTSVTKLDFTKQ
ncbi:MAG: ELWxxDGT repeat protein [Ferruginibacter sp.]